MNIEECGSLEKYAIKLLLKEELNLLSEDEWLKINIFRKQAQILAVRLEAYLFEKIIMEMCIDGNNK